MRYMWAVLLALVVLLGVSVANAAIPVWENGVLKSVTIDRKGESCWSAYRAARSQGVKVDWQELLKTNSCEVVHLGDTIRVPQSGKIEETLDASSQTDAPVAAIADQVVSVDTQTPPADKTLVQKRAALLLPPARPTGLPVASQPASSLETSTTVSLYSPQRWIKTGPTSHVAPEEVCDPTCQLNRAVLARIAGDQVETGSAHADHVAPVETLSVSKKREIVRTTLVAHSYCTSDQVVELHRRLTLATVERNDLIGCGARVLEESLARTSTILYAKLARRNQPQWEPYPVSCQYGGEGSCYERQL